MIHIFLGTKAQLIKMAPIMRLLQDRDIEYNFIFSGQHQNTIENLRDNFGIKEPDFILHKGKDITSVVSMVIWSIKILFIGLLQRRKIWKGDSRGVVLNHGDTFSTLLGSVLSKLSGLKNAHIESGLRSFNIFHPFPEELTRLAVFRLSDFYFAPGDWAVNNLKKFSGIKINTHVNTLYESLNIILEKNSLTTVDIPKEKFAVVSIHRFENISKKKHLTSIIKKLEKISKKINLLFILHKPTEKKLHDFSLYQRLSENNSIELRPRYDYENFIKLSSHAEFVVSDGGSNQEECFYMGMPCLLFRNATERNEGLGENVLISKFNETVIDNFVNTYQDYKRPPIQIDKSASEVIVESLINIK